MTPGTAPSPTARVSATATATPTGTPGPPTSKLFGVWDFETTDWPLLADTGRLAYFHAKGQTLVEVAPVWDWLQPVPFAPLMPKTVAGIRTVLDAAQATGEQVILAVGDFSRYPYNGPPLTRTDAPKFADLWGRLAQTFHGHPALYGYDLMNEPQNLPEGPDAWSYLAQAATDAIRRSDTNGWVLIPGYQAQIATFWEHNNPNLDIHDLANRLLYSAHIFFDDFSGQYRGSYDASGAYPDIGVDRIKPFLQWLSSHNARGILTSYGVPDRDPRWLVVLDRFLQALDDDPRIVGGVYFCAATGCGQLSVEPVGGADQPQMAVLQKHPSRPIPPITTATPTATTVSLPVPLAKGPLLWQASLDGSNRDIFPPYVIGDPSTATIRTMPGAIEAAVAANGGNTGASFTAPAASSYVGELNLAVRPGSDVNFYVNLVNSSDNRHYQVRINATDQVMQLPYADWSTQPPEDYLSPLVAIPGLQSGQTFTVDAVVSPPQMSLFLNGVQAAEVTDTRLAAASAFGFGIAGKGGVVRITGARVFSLP